MHLSPSGCAVVTPSQSSGLSYKEHDYLCPQGSVNSVFPKPPQDKFLWAIHLFLQSAQEVPAAPFPGFLTERFQPLSLGGDLFHFEFLPHFLSPPQNKITEPKKQRSLKYTLNLGRRNARESVEYCCCS